MVGKTLGHYEILEPLGAGGMGEVYRAHDPNLKRDVAIKVLPEELAGDPDRLARLEREAHSLAALNHPNVATIHGLERADDVRFLVLELVEGDTLAHRISAGPLDVEEALRIAAQIAEGLEAAHANGIIHRDLKPANVKITPEGRVKVLDFGLAKSTDAEAGGAAGSGSGTAALTHSPTITAGATEAGVLLGTAPYMSPEQTKAKPVDKRTDIWAFGCVLYEMLTGRQPFTGEDVSDTIASILKEEPDWDALPAATPIAIQSLLRRCLRKDLDRRLHDIADVRIEIEDTVTEPADAVPIAPAGGATDASFWQRAAPWAVAAIATAAAVFLYSQFGSREAPPPVYSSIELERSPEQLIEGRFDNSPVVVSPDGTRIVYKFSPWGQNPFLLRDLTQDTVTPISGTEGGARPFFSPDGNWLGFFGGGELKKIRLDGGGGEAVPLCPVSGNGWGGGSWGPDDRIVWAGRRDAQLGLQQVRADGTGGCTDLTTPDSSKGETDHRWPQMLPNGKGVLFTVLGERYYDEADIVVYAFETGASEVVARGTYARFVPTNGPDSGHLIVARYNTLLAVPFDAERLQTTGAEVPVVSDVYTGTVSRSGSAHFSVSDTGLLVYREILPPTERELVLVDLEGEETRLSLEPRPYEVVRFSPDGESLALITEEGEVYLYELDAERPTLLREQFSDASGIPRIPRFSLEWDADGERLVIGTTSGATTTPLFLHQLGAAEEPLPLAGTPGSETYPASFLQSPARLLYWFTGSGGDGVREMSLEADDAERAFLETGLQLALSADDRLLAYRLVDQVQVYVREYEGSGRERRVSTEGGHSPVWGGPEGRTLYFRYGGSIWAAEVSTEPTLQPGTPRRLFDDPYFSSEPHLPRTYDLSPDGTTFVMIQDLEEPAQTERFQMIQNFFEVLRRDAPAQR